MASQSTLQSLLNALPQFGNLPAIVALQKNGADIWSYKKLGCQALKLAAALVKAGLCPGDRVALCARNCPEWIVASLASIQAGGVAVPMDAQLSDKMLRRILRDSNPRFVFTTEDELPRLRAICGDMQTQLWLLHTNTPDPRSWRDLPANSPITIPSLHSSQFATLFYTSGTSGSEKGVPLTHYNLAIELDSIMATNLLRRTDRILLPLPLHHVYPFVVGMLTPLAMGLPIILPQALTGPQVLRAIREGGATVVIGVPRLYEALFTGLEARMQSGPRIVALLFRTALATSQLLRSHFNLHLGRLLLLPFHKEFGPKLRIMASGGAALDPKLALKLEAMGWLVAIGYGLTETSPLLTLNLPGTAKSDTVGQPMPGVKIRINSDPSAHFSAGQGSSGEVLARGQNIFAGYWNLPQKTAEAFTPDGWFRTGDIGFLDNENYLHLEGRRSALIVTSSGEKIQPEEVEEAYLARSEIGEIGILQKGEKLVAVIVPSPANISQAGSRATEQSIRKAVQATSKRLPSYQRIADFVLTRDPLARTRLGKIRRHLLATGYEKAKAALSRHAELRPMTPEEMSEEDRAMLNNPEAKQIWEMLADQYRDQLLTPNSSPRLDLGIDSMEWLNLTLEIRRRVGVELSEEAIVRVETVRDLLREVSESQADAPKVSWLDQPDTILSEKQRRCLRPQGVILRMTARALLALDNLLIRGFLHFRVQGLDHLPPQQSFVLVPNHLSYLDPFVLAAAIGYRRMSETYWGGMITNPFNRLVRRIAQILPIDFAQAPFSSLALGAAVLKRGKNQVWFPEGTISHDGRLLPFHSGIGTLLERFQALAIPTVIDGTNRVLPFGKVLPRPGVVTISFGPALSSHDLDREGEGRRPSERIASALHKHVAALQESGCSSK